MLRVILSMLLVFSYISGFTQNLQTNQIIVKGKFTDAINLPDSFYENLFRFMKGDYILYDRAFRTMKIDSVINGSFYDEDENLQKPPFKIKVGLINLCGILEDDIPFTLKLKQFPNTEVYYVDSIEQISPNKEYLLKVDEDKEEYKQVVKVLENGTTQDKKDALDDTNIRHYNFTDYRYLKYIMPLMSNKDKIKDYDVISWHGVGDFGMEVHGQDTIWKTIPFNKFLYNYSKIIPIEIPDIKWKKWEKWYADLLNRESFPKPDFVPSENTKILHARRLSYFLPNYKGNNINLKSHGQTYILTESDSLILKTHTAKEQLSYIPNYADVKDNKVAFIRAANLILGEEINEVFYNQKSIEIKELDRAKDAMVIMSENDFIISWIESTDSLGSLKMGKLNIDGAWVENPRTIFSYEKLFATPDLNLTHLRLENGNFIIAFSVRDYKKSDKTSVFLKEIDVDFNVVKSGDLSIDFSKTEEEAVSGMQLAQSNNQYLLLINTANNGQIGLNYILLDRNFKRKTNFTGLSKYTLINSSPVVTNNNFVISWMDPGIEYKVIKSAMINENGKQSKIINVVNSPAKSIDLAMYKSDFVDIYIFTSEKLFRKRISKSEYKF